MTEQISNKPLPENVELAEKLELNIPVIRERMLDSIKRGEIADAHYSAQQIATTEAIIYALRNNRIAKTDEDVERFLREK